MKVSARRFPILLRSRSCALHFDIHAEEVLRNMHPIAFYFLKVLYSTYVD